jgi:Tfp pilus assembly protein PilF
MEARWSARSFAQMLSMLPVRARCPRWLLASLLCILPVSAGCMTENQERFQEYSGEGVRLFQCGDFVSARENFEVALTLEPKDVNLMYDIGQCWDRLGKYDQAHQYYQQCLTAAANHAECRHALAVLLYRNGRAAEADQMIQDWLTSQPQLGAAYVEDGWRFKQSGDLQHAIGRYQQALHYDPKNIRAHVEMGQIYEQQEHPELALAMYVRALEINPQQPYLTDHVNEMRAKGIKKPLPD